VAKTHHTPPTPALNLHSPFTCPARVRFIRVRFADVALCYPSGSFSSAGACHTTTHRETGIELSYWR
jgi:hypothetical protein